MRLGLTDSNHLVSSGYKNANRIIGAVFQAQLHWYIYKRFGLVSGEVLVVEHTIYFLHIQTVFFWWKKMLTCCEFCFLICCFDSLIWPSCLRFVYCCWETTLRTGTAPASFAYLPWLMWGRREWVTQEGGVFVRLWKYIHISGFDPNIFILFLFTVGCTTHVFRTNGRWILMSRAQGPQTLSWEDQGLCGDEGALSTAGLLPKVKPWSSSTCKMTTMKNAHSFYDS